ncbi:nagb/rpia/CoA transferase-like protein [Eremomyces bilateralis CBS 781.70]|uniref:Translation initiation factor eIF2B subunit beta n=1 Tax=Eremomyces bilateralis CBS 781.70 TaxID=1392243 RepID=A0A6G1G9C5_9PEZI|nr:nagb/rpia/CoA transferase-like protein [Eremomyces bilateralis CBS 781.70]KAF1814536.1 nagb/rpia/CoA transferase-like protein [Eremomyces bilateralis CBS 781.70]
MARTVSMTPGLASFLRSLKNDPVEASIEHLISLLKRRQIHNSRPCAIATTQLLLQVVAEFKGKDSDILISRVRHVGQKLITAQPREMAVGNIVRRVLALIREVIEGDEVTEGSPISESPSSIQPLSTPREPSHHPGLPSSISTSSPLDHSGAGHPIDSSPHPSESSSEAISSVHRPVLTASHTSYSTAAPLATSLFGLFSRPETPSPASTPRGFQSPRHGDNPPVPIHQLKGLTITDLPKPVPDDFKADVLDGIREILDELDQVDDQIASYALDHIHSNEIILTHSSSTTVQKFLLTAAKKRKFTVLHVESFPNDHKNTRATMVTGRKNQGQAEEEEDVDDRFSPLTAAGITVVLIPDSAVFAIMSRVNKVILATHSVLANGGLLAAAGAHAITKAAKMHQTPVVVLSGVYKLSPVYALDLDELIEYGDPGKVVNYDDGEFVENVDVVNPLYDHVPPDLVDIYITNLGPHAPSYLYRIVQDHYRKEDITI